MEGVYTERDSRIGIWADAKAPEVEVSHQPKSQFLNHVRYKNLLKVDRLGSFGDNFALNPPYNEDYV